MSVFRAIASVVPAVLRLVGIIGPRREDDDMIELPSLPKPPASPAREDVMSLVGKVIGGREREWLSLLVWVIIRVVENLTGTKVLPVDDTDLALGLGGFALSRGLAKGKTVAP